MNNNDLGYVYFFLNINDNTIKIGFTKNLKQRRKSLSTGSSGRLALLGYIVNNISLEKELHKRFGNLRIRHNGEWFRVSKDLLVYINNNNAIKTNWIEMDELSGKVNIYKRMKNF